MARRNVRKQSSVGWSSKWWWLAVPLIGVAAYVAFDATLGLLTSGGPEPRATSPAIDLAPPITATRAAESAPPAPPASAVAAQDAAPAADDAAPTATPDEPRRAAADTAKSASSAKSKAKKPKEDLTEQDRRALDRVLERAAGQQGH